MSLWDYFWPILAAGLAAGAVGGLVAFRRQRKLKIFAGAIVIALAAAALWHWPLGAADKFAMSVDISARRALDYYEMTKVSGHLHRNPISRTLTLAGPADDFQRGELVRLLSDLPGVSVAAWSPAKPGLPLLVEGFLANLAGFLVGLLLAYLVELHRRHNAQWEW